MNVLFQTPGAQRFVHTLVDDITERRSILVLIPNDIAPQHVWLRLRAELVQCGVWIEEMMLSPLPADQTAITVLSDLLGSRRLSPETPWTVEHLYAASEGLPDVIYLNGLEHLTTHDRQRWISLLIQWAQVSQSQASLGHRPSALCMIVPAGLLLSQLPDSNVYLAIHWWWLFPSVLETQLLCRMQNGSDTHNPLEQWREYILPAIASNDIFLIEHLWNCLDGSLPDLLCALQSFAQKRAWSVETLHEWGIKAFLSNTERNTYQDTRIPPRSMQQLWSYGIISASQEQGIEIHSAALAILGCTDELAHRLWRGQTRLLLPLIDQIRLRLCSHLTRSYGKDWPVRWQRPQSDEEETAVRENPLACQWGHLEYLLRSCSSLRSERRWVSLAELCRQTRNEIAHYRPISFRDFAALCREMDMAH